MLFILSKYYAVRVLWILHDTTWIKEKRLHDALGNWQTSNLKKKSKKKSKKGNKTIKSKNKQTSKQKKKKKKKKKIDYLLSLCENRFRQSRDNTSDHGEISEASSLRRKKQQALTRWMGEWIWRIHTERMYPWWSLCTLYLHACQVRVTVGDSGLCCCTYVTYFES